MSIITKIELAAILKRMASSRDARTLREHIEALEEMVWDLSKAAIFQSDMAGTGDWEVVCGLCQSTVGDETNPANHREGCPYPKIARLNPQPEASEEAHQ